MFRRATTGLAGLPTASRSSTVGVDNFVDNLVPPASAFSVGAPGKRIAELLGRKMLMFINDLDHQLAALRAFSALQASNGAAVELWHRASHGFADE